MKPQKGYTLPNIKVAKLKGNTLGPLYPLTAKTEAQKAENFPFTSEDEVLLKEVLS